MLPLSGVVDLSISDHLLCYYVLESDVGAEVNTVEGGVRLGHCHEVNNVEGLVRVRPIPENRVAR